MEADINITTEILHRLLTKVWEKEEIPEDWREGHLVKLQIKGHLHERSNYRSIVLLSVPGKVLRRNILEKIKHIVDTKIRDEQAGFRKIRSCTNQIATIRIIAEHSIEWNSPLYITFVDYEKAFDSLARQRHTVDFTQTL
jgi:hypothetical protein